MPTNDSAATTADTWPAQAFDAVFLDELKCIKERRVLLQDPSEQGAIDPNHSLNLKKIENAGGSVDYQAVLDGDLSGISISGGGIRSATFGLGVLQGLAAAGARGKRKRATVGSFSLTHHGLGCSGAC